MISISLSQIQYVLALHRSGSFSEAAEACHVTQSTLSTMIKKLEDHTELIIFDRKTKPIQLTKEGESLINQFKVLGYEYDHLVELIQDTRQELYGTLKIGIIPTLAPFLLPLLLKDLISSHPHVKFTVMEITTDEIIKSIEVRELDIGILSIPIADSHLIQKTLFAEDFLIYDGRSKKKKPQQYAVEDIDISRLWILEESHCLSSQIKQICYLRESHLRDQNLIYKGGSILSLIKLVEANKGITLIPRIAMIQDNLLNPDYIYKISAPSPAREIGILTHPNFTKTQLLKSLEEKIMECIAPILKGINEIEIIKPQ